MSGAKAERPNPERGEAALAIGDNMVRISIGCEDADDLIADFAQALRQIG